MIGRTQTEIEVLYDSDGTKQLEDVRNANFQKFDGRVYQGQNNGVFWFKINFGEQQLKSSQVIELENVRISSAILLVENDTIFQSKETLLTTIFVEEPQKATNYLRVTCEKEADIPLKIFSEKQYQQKIKADYTIIGIYYGSVMMALAFNFFFFFSLKERMFLFYAFFLFGMTMEFSVLDGFIGLKGENSLLSRLIDSIIPLTLVSTGVMFATNYLQLQYHIKQSVKIGIVLILLTAITFLIYIVTGEFFYFTLGHVVSAFVLMIYWLFGCYTFKKSLFAKFFTVAYSLILFVAIDFGVLPLIGIPNLGINLNYAKISGVFEMLTLSYAVTLRMRILADEHTEMRNGITNYLKQIESMELILSDYKKQQASESIKKLFTPREIEILQLLASGKTNAEIAKEAFVSINTVKFHIKKIYEKLEVKSRKEAQNKIRKIELSV